MNSFSEPPVSVSMKSDKATGWADVAMRVAHDGPMYAAIALVGVLALKGQASSSEMVITALSALLARSWPRAVQVPGAGTGKTIASFLPLLVGGTIAAKALACAPPSSASSPTLATPVLEAKR